MGWRVLYISESEYLSTILDNLQVKVSEDQKLLVPLKDIHSIIIDNYKLVMSVQLINKCAENNINVVVCGIDHNPNVIMIPHNGHHQMAKVLKDQMDWSTDKKAIVHQIIVQHKIKQQYRALVICDKAMNSKSELVNSYIDEVEISDSTNREGLASKVYFRLMFGEGFQRFDDDIINAGLNFGYAILRSQITKVLVSKGLNTSLGIFHRGPANMFNLADDIIEVYRPIIDIWVYNHLRLTDKFTKEHRVALIKISTINIRYGNLNQSLLNSMVLYVESIMNYFTDDMKIIFPEIVETDEL